MTAAQVLLVDDEPKIIGSLSRELLENDLCQVQAAYNGAEGLEILRKIPDICVVVSDYHMPGMDGITFLREVQRISPDATRIILTGAAGLEMAIKAVNLGQVFRFLVKPCPAELFIPVVKTGIRQYQLITSERELLNKTLNGSVKIMVDILSAIVPETFAQSTRLREMARSLAVALQMEQIWEVELAALLCRIGSVTVPPDVLDKWRQGFPLNEQERAMIHSIPRLGEQLVQNIPRLQAVASGIGSHEAVFKAKTSLDQPSGEKIPIIGRILKIVIDYDNFLMRNYNPHLAMEEMLKHEDEYDPMLWNVFRQKVLGMETFEVPKQVKVTSHERKVNIEDTQPGMILVRDILDRRGRLVVSKGTVITEVLKARLVNFFWSQAIVEPVVVGDETFI